MTDSRTALLGYQAWVDEKVLAGPDLSIDAYLAELEAAANTARIANAIEIAWREGATMAEIHAALTDPNPIKEDTTT